MNGEHRYNIPMFGVKHWYEHEMEAVGHLASMEDAYLRRMYASKVVNGMNHLSKAIQEKITDPGYDHKKRDLEMMKGGIKRTMEHLKKEYDVSEGNISYKWNTKTMNNMSSINKMNSMNRRPSSFNSLSSMNESTFSLPEDSEPLNDNSVLTLRDMNNFDTAKTGNMNAPKFNDDNLNLDENVLSLNKNVLNLNKKNNVMNLNNMNNLNKNKNKNTLIGGRRKSKKARQTRRK
jgi:hypothetical protein